jgi:hypothetical protein
MTKLTLVSRELRSLTCLGAAWIAVDIRAMKQSHITHFRRLFPSALQSARRIRVSLGDHQTNFPSLETFVQACCVQTNPIERSDHYTERSDDFTERSDDFTERSDDFTERSDDFTERSDDFTERSDDFTERLPTLSRDAKENATCSGAVMRVTNLGLTGVADLNGLTAETFPKLVTLHLRDTGRVSHDLQTVLQRLPQMKHFYYHGRMLYHSGRTATFRVPAALITFAWRDSATHPSGNNVVTLAFDPKSRLRSLYIRDATVALDSRQLSHLAHLQTLHVSGDIFTVPKTNNDNDGPENTRALPIALPALTRLARDQVDIERSLPNDVWPTNLIGGSIQINPRLQRLDVGCVASNTKSCATAIVFVRTALMRYKWLRELRLHGLNQIDHGITDDVLTAIAACSIEPFSLRYLEIPQHVNPVVAPPSDFPTTIVTLHPQVMHCDCKDATCTHACTCYIAQRVCGPRCHIKYLQKIHIPTQRVLLIWRYRHLLHVRVCVCVCMCFW